VEEVCLDPSENITALSGLTLTSESRDLCFCSMCLFVVRGNANLLFKSIELGNEGN
jgi:hypothetical protein